MLAQNNYTDYPKAISAVMTTIIHGNESELLGQLESVESAISSLKSIGDKIYVDGDSSSLKALNTAVATINVFMHSVKGRIARIDGMRISYIEKATRVTDRLVELAIQCDGLRTKIESGGRYVPPFAKTAQQR